MSDNGWVFCRDICMHHLKRVQLKIPWEPRERSIFTFLDQNLLENFSGENSFIIQDSAVYSLKLKHSSGETITAKKKKKGDHVSNWRAILKMKTTTPTLLHSVTKRHTVGDL